MDRPMAALEKIQECVSHDACDAEQCEYFCLYEELRDILAWVEELEEKTNTYSHLEGEHGQTAID